MAGTRAAVSARPTACGRTTVVRVLPEASGAGNSPLVRPEWAPAAAATGVDPAAAAGVLEPDVRAAARWTGAVDAADGPDGDVEVRPAEAARAAGAPSADAPGTTAMRRISGNRGGVGVRPGAAGDTAVPLPVASARCTAGAGVPSTAAECVGVRPRVPGAPPVGAGPDASVPDRTSRAPPRAVARATTGPGAMPPPAAEREGSPLRDGDAVFGVDGPVPAADAGADPGTPGPDTAGPAAGPRVPEVLAGDDVALDDAAPDEGAPDRTRREICGVSRFGGVSRLRGAP
ncbi:hypothetical protein [Streptomyces sp. NPDC057686]|uniref:hypothetical protein n=1 Tax=Streptomyces sp. NPDC057686 TaxID=3346212 RepID=UPI00367F0933